MKTLLSSLSLLVFAMACSDGHPISHGTSTSTKGKNNFREMMARGAGVIRPEHISTTAAFGLAGDQIASVKIDEHSGAWTWAGFDPSRGEIIRADADLIAVARAIISERETELGFQVGEVLLQEGSVQQPYEKTRLVTFRRQFQGTEVKGAFINIFFAVQADETLRLSEIVNNSYGPIKLSTESASLLNDSDANAITGVDELKVISKRPVIAPTIKNGRYEFGFSTEFQMQDTQNGEIVSMTVDNESKTIQESYSNHAYEVNEISAETFKTSYVFKDLIVRPLKYLRILDGNEQKTTDETGKVDVSSKQVKVSLFDTRSNSGVFAEANKQTPITFDTTLGDGKTTIKLDGPSRAGLNVFASLRATLDFAGKHLKDEELKLFTKGVTTTVDINKTCNAFYVNATLNFFREGSGCGNTGLISDVVAHEWGHALDDFIGPTSRQNGQSRGITDGAYSEGIGDIISAYMSRTPGLAAGLQLNSTRPLRNLQNTAKHPPANASQAEVHILGTVIGGAFWDMHVGLTDIYGSDVGNDKASRLFLRHLISSDRYLDAYKAVLRVDDDDNNVMTKSPHHCTITRAFDKHNVSGGEKAGEDCIDTDTTVTVKIDQDQGDGKLALVLSAGGASQIIGCPGKVTACKAADKGYIDFTGAEGDDSLTAKNGRRYYQGKGVVDTVASGIYTFFSLDAKSAIVAKRTLEFKGPTGSPD